MHRQLEMFSKTSNSATNGGLRDPAFAENKTLPIHRWVPWIAGYSASFVDDVLTAYAPRDALKGAPDVVLDPFAGVGTTLVQAMLRGYQTVGFEINPYAALAAQVKVCSPFLDLAKLKRLIEDEDATSILVEKLRQMARDVEWAQTHWSPSLHVSTSHRVFNTNFMATAEKELSGLSVDVAITSPPYMNNYHYVRNTRPQLYWLALVDASSATKQLEQENFGKFWQNVRTAAPLEPQFTSRKLQLLIGKLRKIRAEKGPYGGPGWANYVTAYFNDAQRFFCVLNKVLKHEGVGVIVIGNSIIQGIEFKVDEFLAELAESEGLIAETIHPIRQKRVGASITQSSVRRGKPNGATLYESALIVRRPCG
jgi:hypothetical protein